MTVHFAVQRLSNPLEVGGVQGRSRPAQSFEPTLRIAGTSLFRFPTQHGVGALGS